MYFVYLFCWHWRIFTRKRFLHRLHIGTYFSSECKLANFPSILQIAYYVNRRDKPEEWKCQPYQWLPKELEIHEIVVGAFSLALGSFISASVACWVMNDGYSKIYFDPAEHGYLWLILQLPIIFIWQVNDVFSLEQYFAQNMRNRYLKFDANIALRFSYWILT